METKKKKIASLLSSIGLIFMLFGATYAYFKLQVNGSNITDVEITANTVDVFTFEIGDPISFELSQENFANNMGNIEASTFAKATLTANNKTNLVTEHYFLYLCILENEYTYSKSEEYPEIILSIKDQDNNEIKDIEGLNYIDSLGGFDITEEQGTVMILNNREITANPFKEENWTATITFINHEFNQAGNAGKSFRARLKISKVVTHIVALKLNNATSSEMESIVSAQSDSSFSITENEGYKFASYTCTNGQNGDFNNGVFTVEDICADTTCTVNYVPLLTTSETTEYDTTRKYKVRIYGNVPEGASGEAIYDQDDWTYNDFLNAYEKEFYFNETVTLPDASDMFKIDGYVDNNNFTRISKELEGYFVIYSVYPSVVRAMLSSRSIVDSNNRIIVWPNVWCERNDYCYQRFKIKKTNEGFYKLNLENLYSLQNFFLEPTSEIQTWSGLAYEMWIKNDIGNNYMRMNTYERFGDWKQIKLAEEDEMSSLQEWAFIYDSHGNFFIRNRQSGDYMRNGSTAATYVKYPYTSSSYKYDLLNITTEITVGGRKYPDGTVVHTGGWEIPVITTPIFKEVDAYRYSFVNIDSYAIRSPHYNADYYKYLRYSDTSLPFEEPSWDESSKNQDYSAYRGTIKDIETTISKGTSNYQLSDIDGDIVHLYSEWVKE